jgi:Zn-dependent protease with chaperone function
MHTLKRHLPALIAAGLAMSQPATAQTQLFDLLKKLPAPGAGIPLNPLQPSDSAGAAAVGNAPPVAARAEIEAELKPDADCNRPREKFDVAEKLMHYGGTAATLRLTRLVESEFAYDDLTEEDKTLLRYMALTTVWLPVQAEDQLGAIFDAGSTFLGQAPKLTELDEEAMKQIAERLDLLKKQANDFPGKIRLTLDDQLATGAFARFGGVISVSKSFLSGLTQDPAGADFVLAHELSHIYKRHPIKDIQYKLISSREGWQLSRKVLQRAMKGLQINPLSDAAFGVTVMPQLVQYVRNQQLTFGRDQELEADACSVAWLKGIGSDPIVAWKAFRSTLAATDTGPTAYASTHPSTPERETRFTRKATEEAPATGPRPNRPTVARDRANKP